MTVADGLEHLDWRGSELDDRAQGGIGPQLEVVDEYDVIFVKETGFMGFIEDPHRHFGAGALAAEHKAHPARVESTVWQLSCRLCLALCKGRYSDPECLDAGGFQPVSPACGRIGAGTSSARVRFSAPLPRACIRSIRGSDGLRARWSLRCPKGWDAGCPHSECMPVLQVGAAATTPSCHIDDTVSEPSFDRVAPMKHAHAVIGLWSAVIAGCADVEDHSRAAFVQGVLVDDNRIWLYRYAPVVAEKFASMGRDRYDFMRGSVALHFADLERPTHGGPSTRFLNVPDATAVLIFGDPHPENATVCRTNPSAAEPEPPLTVEFVDLDAAGYGPWILDLRRLALAMSVLMADLPGCSETCRQNALVAVAGGYLDGLEPAAAVSIAAAQVSSTEDWGTWLTELFEESLEEGAEQKKVNRYAPEDVDGVRRLQLGPDTSLVSLTIDEERILTELTKRMALPTNFRMLDAARRLGSGVSSLAALRFVVLWDRGLDETTDDALLQMREVIDAPAFPGRPNRAMGVFSSNHLRVEQAAKQLWTRPDADPLHVTTRVDGLSWKTLSWTSYFQDVDHLDIVEEWVEGSIDEQDLADLGHDLARSLAASHARARTMTGLSSRSVILADIDSGGGSEALEVELLSAARSDLERLVSDHEIFVSLLETEGPLLGAEYLLDGVLP
ncbi:MAG TPA: hypothetical protein DFR83_00850 [Deltaproteobacteria bacterium]|nr:hypothetical protein [Deltaproteobacteria bacterium]